VKKEKACKIAVLSLSLLWSYAILSFAPGGSSKTSDEFLWKHISRSLSLRLNLRKSIRSRLQVCFHTYKPAAFCFTSAARGNMQVCWTSSRINYVWSTESENCLRACLCECGCALVFVCLCVCARASVCKAVHPTSVARISLRSEYCLLSYPT
jgi:hypothetical protein